MFHRAPGSIGASAFPSRVMKGMRAAGHMGNAQVTTRNLRVVQVLPDENTILIEGSVPGPQGGYVVVHKAKAPHK
jgi:large subunit ribosomal protein L3